MTATENAAEKTQDGERADLLEALAKHRYFLRHTVRDLTDEQAAQRPTASALVLGGLIKHVTLVEHRWASFILDGPAAMSSPGEDVHGKGAATIWVDGFRMLEGET